MQAHHESGDSIDAAEAARHARVSIRGEGAVAARERHVAHITQILIDRGIIAAELGEAE